MADIAKRLSAEDIRAVALYFEWLGPEETRRAARLEAGAGRRGRSGG